MKKSGSLKVEARGEREIVMTRRFDAPPQLVFDAHTKPEIVKRWLGVRAGWTLAVCEIEPKEGGTYRYVWRHDTRGAKMGVRGFFREVKVPERLVYTELFDDAWYAGEALVTVTFSPAGLSEGATTTEVVMTIRYESTDARDGVLRSPATSGVAESYDLLATLLTAMS